MHEKFTCYYDFSVFLACSIEIKPGEPVQGCHIILPQVLRCHTGVVYDVIINKHKIDTFATAVIGLQVAAPRHGILQL